MTIEPFFLPASTGQRYCVHHPPEGAVPERGALIFIHPFAEEMNKSRRMAAVQSRALAQAGYRVLRIDLQGCGDSSGDFCDATWAAWVDDVALAVAWLRQRTDAPLWLWGLRSGCLVASAAARAIDGPASFLFWQPTASGKLFLQQFLRLKMAGALQEADSKGMTQSLKRQLAAGDTVEVAGYRISSTLAAGLEEAELTPPDRPGRLEWLELTSQPQAELNPVSQKHLEAWRLAGHQARGRVVNGQQFWQTVETTECRSLVEATLKTLEESYP